MYMFGSTQADRLFAYQYLTALSILILFIFFYKAIRFEINRRLLIKKRQLRKKPRTDLWFDGELYF